MKKIKVWDGATRLFHWSLVTAFALSAYSAFEDKYGIYADIHLWSGLADVALVSWRIVWALLGSETSKFSHFLKSPLEAIRHARGFFKKSDNHPVGHNALGGYSVLLMLVLLLAQAVMGLYSSDDMFFEGPLAGKAEGLSSKLTELHEGLGVFLLYFVGFHIFVIIAYRLLKGLNLLWPMISGYMKAPEDTAEPRMKSQWLAFILFLLVGGIVYYVVFRL